MTADLFGSQRAPHGFGGVGGGYTRETWLTPRHVLDALGPFDLDPCAAPAPRPWPTARRHVCLPQDGLARTWKGRVWLNPPYGKETGRWLSRLAAHEDGGIALVFVRSDTQVFQQHVLGAGAWVLFLEGRLTFCDESGKPGRFNGGAPNCLVAYCEREARVLAGCGLAGVLMRPAVPSDLGEQP